MFLEIHNKSKRLDCKFGEVAKTCKFLHIIPYRCKIEQPDT